MRDDSMTRSRKHNVIPMTKPRMQYLHFMKKGLVIFMKCMVEDVTLNDIKKAWNYRCLF